MHFVYMIRTTDNDLLHPYYSSLSNSEHDEVSEVHAHSTDMPVRDWHVLVPQNVDASEEVVEAIIEQIQVMMDFKHHHKINRILAKTPPPRLSIVELSNAVLVCLNT